jgi:hypothetical protein
MEQERTANKKYIIATTAIGMAILALIFIAIANKKNSFVCKSTSDQPNMGYIAETTTTIYYDNDIVTKAETTREINANAKEKLDELLDSYIRQYDLNNNSYGGYSYATERTNDESAKFKGTIDYKVVDFAKFVKDNPAMNDYSSDGKLTKDGAKRMYKASGATCEEN